DQTFLVDLYLYRRLRQDRFDLRPEGEDRGRTRVVQRLDAVAVARQQQRALMPVPQRQREHAVEAQERPLAPFPEGVKDDFRVAGRAELIAQRLELDAQLAEIIDFAVVGYRVAAVRGRHRLMPGRRQVDDRQAPMSEAERAVDELALAVRPAMADAV